IAQARAQATWLRETLSRSIGLDVHVQPLTRCALLMRIVRGPTLPCPSERNMSRRSTEAAKKQATNVSIRSDLVAAAREAGINLSETLERALVAELDAKRKERWLEENREAIADYNSFVEERGVFSDGLRSF